MGFPSRGILSVAECFLEPRAVRIGVVRPVDRAAQVKNPVDDLWAKRGVLFEDDVSREPQGGLAMVHCIQRGVSRH